MDVWLGSIIISIPIVREEDLLHLPSTLSRISFLSFTDISSSIAMLRIVEELMEDLDFRITYISGRTIRIGVYGEYQGLHFFAKGYSIISCTDYANTLYAIQTLIASSSE